jgi:hypothetical protein
MSLGEWGVIKSGVMERGCAKHQPQRVRRLMAPGSLLPGMKWLGALRLGFATAAVRCAC